MGSKTDGKVTTLLITLCLFLIRVLVFFCFLGVEGDACSIYWGGDIPLVVQFLSPFGWVYWLVAIVGHPEPIVPQYLLPLVHFLPFSMGVPGFHLPLAPLFVENSSFSFPFSFSPRVIVSNWFVQLVYCFRPNGWLSYKVRDSDLLPSTFG